MLTLTSPVRTWAHRVPAWVKLGALCAWTLAMMRLEGIWLAGAMALVLALAASGGGCFLPIGLGCYARFGPLLRWWRFGTYGWGTFGWLCA